MSADTAPEALAQSVAPQEQPQTETYTVIIRDEYDGYDDPLIYTVKISGEPTEEKFMAAVRKWRAADLGGDDVDEDDMESWLDKLRLCFAFKGDLATAFDWRM